MFLKECDVAMPESLLCSVNFEFITEERLSIFFSLLQNPFALKLTQREKQDRCHLLSLM